jgi:DNA-binding NarL/FixJ family response regulator
MIAQRDILVFIVEHDIYARQAIASYLSWDRRTRVVGRASTVHEMFAYLQADPIQAHLDAVVLDTRLAADAPGLEATVEVVRYRFPDTIVICLAHGPDRALALAAAHAGASAYLTREEVGVGIANAVRFVLRGPFVVTQDVYDLGGRDGGVGIPSIRMLPNRRHYPRLTERIEQALWLCVLEGLPAELAAEEMGVSTNTVRSYIKEGYRILETYDETTYPSVMSPVERAFQRYTALEQAGLAWEWEGAPFVPAA